MSVTASVTITVPATTANLGPGFDCLGAALTLYNRFEFTLLPETCTAVEPQIIVTGEDADNVRADKHNLLYQAFVEFYQQLGQTVPSVAIKIELGVPLARGLGSSATAIVGGLVGANTLAENPLSRSEVVRLAIALEGHPDNVVPALLGSCQLCVGKDNTWEISEVPWHDDIIPVVAVPEFELSTQAARSVLPARVSRSEAIFNIAHLGLLLRGLETGNGSWLSAAMEDKLHQPYRQALIPGYKAVKAAAREAGAYGMVISGAGPTLLALTNQEHALMVANAMAQAWTSTGISAQSRSLSLDTQGARIIIP